MISIFAPLVETLPFAAAFSGAEFEALAVFLGSAGEHEQTMLKKTAGSTRESFFIFLRTVGWENGVKQKAARF